MRRNHRYDYYQSDYSDDFQIEEVINDSQNRKIFEPIKKYIASKKKLYNDLITFLENEDNENNDISKLKYNESKLEFKEFLQSITAISCNHYPGDNFLSRIYQIIDHCKDEIIQTFSYDEIFRLFRKDKKILLYLFKNNIIKANKELFNTMYSNGKSYCYFFYPEIKEFDDGDEIKNELLSIDPNIFDQFEEKQQQGQNDSYICSLIRQDSVEDFIIFINQYNISLDMAINSSIFETNDFLINREHITLIEYSAFYGSIKIFKYLKSNDVELTPSLWLYAIHSKNAELINLLESENVLPPNDNYISCLAESIRCHHNDITNYIQDNLFKSTNPIQKNPDIITSIIQSHNYSYFPSIITKPNEFFDLVYYEYEKLTNIFIVANKHHYGKKN